MVGDMSLQGFDLPVIIDILSCSELKHISCYEADCKVLVPGNVCGMTANGINSSIPCND